MQEFLVDTNIIIYHLSGDDTATKFIDNNLGKLHISFITYIEVLAYNFETKEEERIIRNFLNCFNLMESNKNIIEKAIELRRIKKVKLPDCIIAATAKTKNYTLVTRNTKDFNNIGIEVYNPYTSKEL